MNHPQLDKPGRCAWCGGAVAPGQAFCSEYCRRYRSAWSNVPFGMALTEEGTPRNPREKPPPNLDKADW